MPVRPYSHLGLTLCLACTMPSRSGMTRLLLHLPGCRLVKTGSRLVPPGCRTVFWIGAGRQMLRQMLRTKYTIVMKYLLLILFAVGAQTLQAQSPAWLDSIAANNSTLRALKGKLDADLTQNRAELRWEDPEAEVEYMFAAPKGVDAETSVTLTQSLDWSLITGHKRKMIKAADEVTQQSYRLERQNILAEGRRQLTLAVYFNRLCKELRDRLDRAHEVQKLYEGKYSSGDINRMEWNKVRLNTSITQTELERAQTERRALMLELQRLNGGKPLDCRDTTYTLPALPALVDFMRQIEHRHPLMKGAEAAVSQAEHAVKVVRTESFPSLNVGYTGTFSKGIRSNGMTVGLSIPLWGKKRMKVRENRIRLDAQQMEMTDVALQLRAQISRQYATAMNLHNSVSDLQRDLAGTDNNYYLRRLLEEGQISLLDYLLELSFYYTARTALLEAERDSQLAQADLWSLLL